MPFSRLSSLKVISSGVLLCSNPLKYVVFIMCRTYESLNYSHVVMLFSQVGKCFTEKNETHVVAFLSFQYFGGNMQVAEDDKDLSSDLNGNFF